MIKTFAKEVIDGALSLVENISYSDGSKVKRIIDPKTNVPLKVIDVC